MKIKARTIENDTLSPPGERWNAAKKLLCLLLIPYSLSLTPVPAQTHVIDSLKAVLKTQKDDTSKVNTLNALSEKLWRIAKYDISMVYANKALTLATQLQFEKGRGWAFSSIGLCFNYLGNYSKALNNYGEELSVFRKIGNKKGIGNSFNNIGGVFYNQGNYPKALEYWLKTLALYQEIGDKNGCAGVTNNIGLIYLHQHYYSKALEYYFKALYLNQKLENPDGESVDLGNIGEIYSDKKKYDSALKYEFKALHMDQKTGNRSNEANTLGIIGGIYAEQGNYARGLEYYFHALSIDKEVGDIRQYGEALSDIGYTCIKQKKYVLSKSYLDSALLVSKKIGDKELLESVYSSREELDSAKGEYKAELQDSKYYDIYRDSLNDEKTVQEETNYEADRKADSLQAEQDKKDIIKEKETQHLKVIRNFLMGGGSVAFLAAGVFFFQRRRIAKEKKRSDELLLNILPEETAEELKAYGESKAKSFDVVTVMFTDFVGFTKISEKLSPDELVNELHYLFQHFDNIAQRHNLEKIKTIGDSYMAAGGLPVPNQTHAKDAVSAAIEIRNFMQHHNTKRATENKPVFEVRIGINTGPVVAGIVGIRKFAYDIWGDTVNIASRMESASEAGKINISGSTYEMVKNDFTCTYRGKVEAKNKGEVDMYFVNEM